MSAPIPSHRRIAIAIGTAAASVTVAIGITAGSLLGWFKPSSEPPAPTAAAETQAPAAPSPAVILVPVAPSPSPPTTEAVGDVQLAIDDGPRRRSDAHDGDDHERRDRGRDHDEREEHDDDD